MLVEESNIQISPEKVRNDVLESLDKYHLAKYMFEEYAWITVNGQDVMKRKIAQCTCPVCKSLFSDEVSKCSCCKNWFHRLFMPNADLSKKQWFCEIYSDPATKRSDSIIRLNLGLI